MGYVYAIVGLSLLIVVHEAGHMIVARLAGMRVMTFSVGFGPALLRWRGRKTTYQVAAIPLGGYVQIAGMNPHEELPEDDPGSYANKSPLMRFLVILAGPLTNYLLAIVMMIVFTTAWGFPQWQHLVGKVTQGAPADQAGMRAGDIIVAIDGEAVETTADVITRIKGSAGKALAVTVRRDSATRTLRVTPASQDDTYRIGIQFGQKLTFQEVGTGRAVLLGLIYPIEKSRQALVALGKLLSDLLSGRSTDQQVGGPVEIVHQLKLSFEQSIAMALLFLAMLSAYLGLFNLLPVPALDGGRILFLLAQMVSRRPINQRLENAIHTVGFILLLALIALVTYCDVARRVAAP